MKVRKNNWSGKNCTTVLTGIIEANDSATGQWQAVPLDKVIKH